MCIALLFVRPRVLSNSPFYVFISFRPAAEWSHLGLTCIQPVAKLRVTTTGKEGLTCFIYINVRFPPDCSGLYLPQRSASPQVKH